MDAEFVHELPPVHLWHHEIEEDQARLNASELGQRVGAVPAANNLKAFAGQRLGDAVARRVVVFDYQNAMLVRRGRHAVRASRLLRATASGKRGERRRSAPEKVDDPVADDQQVGDVGGRRVVGGAEVGHEVVPLREAAPVEVAGVRRLVDRHGAREEVVMAPVEVVDALVLFGRHRHDGVDGRCRRDGFGRAARPCRGEGEEQGCRVQPHGTRVRRAPASHKPRLTLPDDSSRSGPSVR